MTKPTELPRWATSPVPADVVEPPSLKKDGGWLTGEKPPHSYFNWLLNRIYQWTQYLDGLTAEPLTWTADHIFDEGIEVNKGAGSFAIDSERITVTDTQHSAFANSSGIAMIVSGAPAGSGNGTINASSSTVGPAISAFNNTVGGVAIQVNGDNSGIVSEGNGNNYGFSTTGNVVRGFTSTVTTGIGVEGIVSSGGTGSGGSFSSASTSSFSRALKVTRTTSGGPALEVTASGGAGAAIITGSTTFEQAAGFYSGTSANAPVMALDSGTAASPGTATSPDLLFINGNAVMLSAPRAAPAANSLTRDSFAKAWVRFAVGNPTATIESQLNVSGVATFSSGGNFLYWEVTLATPMASTDYVPMVCAKLNKDNAGTGLLTYTTLVVTASMFRIYPTATAPAIGFTTMATSEIGHVLYAVIYGAQ